ncbi:hypothetical protein A3G98_02090 [Candidatus Nomurabacteria bacterium RIFCSPLOWO2_12_FULL_37_8]|uniref:Uncharacterized protein n=1 Tax=Candidatus Nomurabacteria bacterium RIFCSPLOWO2_12_FULL_37_8 TaxID=1801793 RepID=A0A1F6Y751_9BACT|nr:MAG: hypothetical protein A3G98_02090 [Candidatus Nomurabacteria bacterium RIFCSPLOWO2_12_FULL_37_8]
MKKIIHHIRKQSEETRRHILHFITIVFGIILLSLWAYSLGTSIASSDARIKINNDLEPLSALKDNLVGGYKNISE